MSRSSLTGFFACRAPQPSVGGAAVSDGGLDTDTEGLYGSAVASWNSGGTADVLPYERSQASFGALFFARFSSVRSSAFLSLIVSVLKSGASRREDD